MTAGNHKNVTKCNFRSAGRISNEDLRALASIHEGLARSLTIALDAFLGTGLEVKLQTLDQKLFQEHIAGLPSLSCIVPFSAPSVPGAMFVECDTELVFLTVDLLLGGAGIPGSGSRELSEIEEEIMLEVFSLILRQAETAWRLPSGALTASKCVKPAFLDQYCSLSEKVACLKFLIEIGEHAGAFQLVLPSAFLNILLQQIKTDKPQKRTPVRNFPRLGIRDRILDSDVQVAVELPGLKIAVKDLLALLPGSVLKLRTPVRTPGMLVAGGHGIFEATPVRNGSRKAAQLGRRMAAPNLERM